mmetsp:Transcript_91779/g.163348  ORF Transcript_91779/g.163348 Transcript_91779/m.163348 type:complete len:148 (-) Transcript_91779:80-523(-)
MATSTTRVALAVVLVLACMHLASATMTWKSCGKPSDHCPASKVVMSPDPAVVGKNVTFTVTCTSDETVSGGESQSNIYLYGIKVLSHTVDLCTLQKCPSPPGTHSVTGGMVVESITPTNVPLNLIMHNTDQNKNELNCVSVTFEATD